MSTYFQGWRRKVGVVTLLMAVIAMAGWVMSLTRGDTLVLRSQGQTLHFMTSAFGHLVVMRQREWPLDGVMLKPRISGWFEHWGGWHSTNDEFSLDSRIEWISQFIGFKFGILDGTNKNSLWSQGFVVIPYWSIVIPLTLFSACLLLRKPRVAEPKTPAIAN